MSNKAKTYLHGEAMITEVTGLPVEASRLEVKDNHLIIAPSEVVGNHHVVDCAEGVEFYELDGVRYMKNEKPATVRCLHEGRHDEIQVHPGVHQFGIQKEYDYFEEAHRNVAD